MESKRLAGMVALVTGSGGGENGGMGSGIARCLAREGAAVVVNDLKEEYAELTVAQLKGMGAEAIAVVGDVSNSAQADHMIQAAVSRFGQIDILVNNAGIGGRVPAVERMVDEVWHRTMGVDLNGPFFMARAALRFMIPRRSGRIINISSLAGQRTGFMSGAPYTAAKSGLLGFTRHLAIEVAEHGITVNAILPAGTLGPAQRRAHSPEKLAELGATRPLGRYAYPEDIGEMAAFLASSAASYLTGTAIPVDGGLGCLTGNFATYKSITNKDPG